MKTILIAILFILSPLAKAQSAAPAPSTSTVQLVWNLTPEPVGTSFVAQWGTNSGVYGTSNNVGTNLSCTISNLARGQTYYFSVYATNGILQAISSNSPEVQYTVLTGPVTPSGFTIIVLKP